MCMLFAFYSTSCVCRLLPTDADSATATNIDISFYISDKPPKVFLVIIISHVHAASLLSS